MNVVVGRCMVRELGGWRRIPALTLLCVVTVLVACNGTTAVEVGTPSQGQLTFNRDIAPIIFENCAGCHRPGEAGPFSLLSYTDVSRRTQQIVAVIQSRFMPPWLPEPGDGDFADERRLNDSQVTAIQQWAQQGAIEGDPADLPLLPTWTEGWQIGEPDLVVQMPEPYTLAAEGLDVFRNFSIPIPLEATRYVRGIEFRPGNPKIVHHASILIDKTERSREREKEDPEPGFTSRMLLDEIFSPDGHWLSWTPGKQPVLEPEDMSWRLEKGSSLVLELHMLPTGKPESIQASVGLFFTSHPPKKIPVNLRLGSQTIDIPPGKKDYIVKDSYVLPADVEVLKVYPHAHYLGKEMKGYVELPDGTKKSLIYIKEWDFNWQDEYRYAEPFFLPKGASVSMEFTYDNSNGNVRNPNNPPRRVVQGWLSSNEMGDLWLQVLPRQQQDLATLRRDFRRKELVDLIAGYEKKLQETPGDYEKHNLIGNYYLELGQAAKARTYFERAVSIEPGYADGHYNLGVLFETEGLLARAVQRYRRAVQSQPGHVQARNNLGNLLLSQGKREEALQHYRRVLQESPDFAEALNNMGNVLQINGQTHEAMNHYRRALKIKPDYPEAHNNLGNVLSSQGRFDSAVQHYRQALLLNPEFAEAHNNLGSVLGNQGKLTEALQSFRRAVEEDPDYAEAHRNLGIALQALGRLEEARRHFRLAESAGR